MPPRRSLENAALAAFLASAGAGARDAAHPSVPAATRASLADVGRFLERARGLVPVDARVLVVTPRLWAPHFEFWFGLVHPVAILFEVRPANAEALLGAVAPETLKAIEDRLAEKGVLLTPDALAKEAARADFVLLTDDLATVDVARTPLASATPVLVDGPRRLLRLDR